ncbi:MAG: precorrin-3B synthase [Rhodospirillales bacterium]|nr:precorrin-3B synthase [Rhodospirillales bacterium]
MIVKGWCPGAWRPMMAEDGLILRIRPPEGRLSAMQAQGLAALAREEGQARISLTSRANLQMRGVRPERHEPLLQGLAELGLLDDDEAMETARNIIVTPFWQADDGTLRLAHALAQALPEFPALPGKFGFAIDCGARPVLGDVSADIRLERNAAGRLLVRADGSETGDEVTEATAIPRMKAMAEWFLAQGGKRMRQIFPDAHRQTGFAPVPGPSEAGMLVAFAFGEIPLETLARLGEMRLTPWRMVLLPGVETLPEMPGTILTPNDPMLRVFACTGAPNCAQGFAPVRDLAAGLAAHLPAGTSLHVSGCGKGCAHQTPANFTLVAGTEGFTLNGTRAGLDPAWLLSHPGEVFGTE